MNILYKVITPAGKVLWFGFTRYDADKALFAANESAQLFGDSTPLDNNFDVFPSEAPAEISTWIPVTSRLPEVDEEGDYRTDWMLVATPEGCFIAAYWPESDDNPKAEWRTDSDHRIDITHWQTLPPLP